MSRKKQIMIKVGHNLSFMNMEAAKVNNIKKDEINTESLSTNKVSFGSECMEQLTFACDISMTEAIFESVKCEQNEKGERIPSNDTEISIKKEEVDADEHELSYEQRKSIKTEDFKIQCNNECIENTAGGSCVSSNKLDFDHGQYANDLVTIKREENIKQDDPSDDTEVDVKKQNAVQHWEHNCYKYEGGETRHCKLQTKIERYLSVPSAHKAGDKSTLQTHIKVTRKGNVKYFKCRFCEYITKYTRSLKRHFTVKHNENADLYYCFNRKYKTKVKNDLVLHFRVHQTRPTKRHHCHLCDFKTKYKNSLSLHWKSKHDDADEFYCCELCDFKTKYKHCLLQHHRMKHDDTVEIFHCELCDYKTKHKYSLLRHHKSKHDDSADNLHCKMCDHKTKRRDHLLQHRRSKHDESAEVFHCELREFKTKHKQSLLRHHRLKHVD